MKFKIVVVEDEPKAQRHLRTIIEKKCPEFEISGVAGNGDDGLKIIEKIRPHLLISDIRMPGMDGIELIEIVKNRYPETFSIIISGYQEFEYAKKAICSEVVDYVLKPISIPVLVELLDGIHEKLVQREHLDVLQNLIRQFSTRYDCSSGSTRSFSVALIRRNGPLPRSSGFSGNNPTIQVDSVLSSVLTEDEETSMWLLQGQDDNEWYLIGDADSLHCSRFREIIGNFSLRLPECHYYTAILSLTSRGQDLFSRLVELYRLLNNKLTPGKSQIVYDDSSFPDSDPTNQSLDSTFYKKLDYVCTNNVLELIKDDLSTAFRKWRKNQLPAQQILLELKHVTTQILQYCPEKREQEHLFELKLDDLIKNCRDFEDLEHQFYDLVMSLVCHLNCHTTKTGSRESVEKITSYISSHIAEDLMIPFLSQKFSISQSYLNRIFHKHTGGSVVNFIRDTRIEKSVEIMKRFPEIPLKDIAVMIGYHDASYFSKVFKTKKGISPQYLRDLLLIDNNTDYSISL